MKKIGKYEILERLGSGAQGVTFKVRNEVTGEVFAMKCFLYGNKNDESVKREIIIHKDLYHPNVIELKEVFSDENKLGIVMEFLEGDNLSTVLTMDGAFGESKARKMFQELIAGVSYIHFKNISHRDLNPNNILLASNGNSLKICDFGLSKSSVLHSKAKSEVGTGEYMAPEVSHAQPYDGKLADVWSCGMILHYMLTRNYPDCRNGRITSQCVNLLNVSNDCKDLIGRMLVKNPAEEEGLTRVYWLLAMDRLPIFHVKPIFFDVQKYYLERFYKENVKRTTINAIKKHPWYLRDLPDFLKEEVQAVYLNSQNKAAKMENYERLNKLGSGAFSLVFKVRDRQTGEVFAMKCFPRGDKIDEKVKEEIMNLRDLHHPNVIRFKEVVLDDIRLGIVMEYVDGGDLSDQVLIHGPFNEDKARKMFQKLIAGVSYIHFKGICHRNLKSENILLSSNGNLKIGGFRLSKSAVVRTPGYSAPELIDVWRCGLTLHRMLTGDYPSHTNPNAIALADVSEECKDLLSRMLVTDPTKRITIDEIKNHPWYLMELPDDLKEDAQANFRKNQNVTSSCQSVEDLDKIIEQAKVIILRNLKKSEEAKISIADQGEDDKILEDVKMKKAKLTPE